MNLTSSLCCVLAVSLTIPFLSGCNDSSKLEADITRLQQEAAAREKVIAEQTAKIEKMESLIQKYREHYRKTQGGKQSTQGKVSAGKFADFIHKPLVDDAFPVYIYNAKGGSIKGALENQTVWKDVKRNPNSPMRTVFRTQERKVIGGRLKEADNVRVRQPTTYFVRFSAQNYTKTPKTFNIDAGGQKATITLAAGKIESGYSVEAARGSDLKVTCGEETRTVKVQW